MRTILEKFRGDLFAIRFFSAFIGGTGLLLLLGLVLLRAVILHAELAGLSLVGAIGGNTCSELPGFWLGLPSDCSFLVLSGLMTSRVSQKILAIVYFLVALLVLLWGTANLEVVRILGEPVTLELAAIRRVLGAINAVGLAATFSTFLLVLLITSGLVSARQYWASLSAGWISLTLRCWLDRSYLLPHFPC